MNNYLIASCILVLVASFLLLGSNQAYATPFVYNQTAISIPWTVQARNSTVTDLFTNNDTHLLNMQFENNLIDNSNYYNNSTWSGSSSFVTGKWGSYATNFTGSNYITVKNPSLFSFEYTQPLTISFWFKEDSKGNTNYGQIVSKGSMFGNNYYSVWTINNILVFEEDVNHSTNNYIQAYITTSSVSDGLWHQYVITYSGNGLINGINIYKDGVSQSLNYGGSSLSGSIVNTNPLTIGNSFSTSYPLSGSIDDLHIFNRVLSQADITADFNTGIYPTKPTLITNWYHYSGGSNIYQKLGTNTATLALGCTGIQGTLIPQGENVLADCTNGTGSTLLTSTNAINSFSGSDSILFHSICKSITTQKYTTVIFPTKQLIYNFCLGDTGVANGTASTGQMTTVLGNTTVYGSTVNQGVSQLSFSNQKLTFGFYTAPTFTPKLKFNTNSTNGIDSGLSSFTTDICDLTFIPTNATLQIQPIGCPIAIGANQIKYFNGTQIQNIGNYYTNSTLSLFSSIQDNQYKSALTLFPNLLGIAGPYSDFILYTPSANYMVVLTGTPSSGNIYYINVNTIVSLLAKNYAYQTYMMSTQSTPSSFGVNIANLAQTVRLYGPSNLNTTTNIGGMFTVTSPYTLQAFSNSTANGQTRILDPQWTNFLSINYPIIWTPKQLLYPIFLTISNAPTDAGLLAVNNNVSINSTQQTWAVIRLDSTHSGEFDVPPGICADLYVSDISVKPAIYTFQGSVCATGANQKTVAYTNSLPLNFYNFPYGATDSFVPSTNTLTTTVRATVVPFTYTETITNSSGTILSTTTFNASLSPDTQTFNVSVNGQPLLLKVSAGGNQIFSDYLGSSFSLASTASFFHQYFNYQGFDLLSFIPLVFASMFTSRSVSMGVILTVVLIASLNLFSVVVLPSQYIFIMSLVGVIALIAGRQIYG